MFRDTQCPEVSLSVLKLQDTSGHSGTLSVLEAGGELTVVVLTEAEAAGFRTPPPDRGGEEDSSGRRVPGPQQTAPHQDRGEGAEEGPTEDQEQGELG